jgi:large repetitive protein
MVQINSVFIDTAYTVSCILPNSCVVYPDKIIVKVLPPVPSITTSSLGGCIGEKITLTANGCLGSLKWSNGSTHQSIQIMPTFSQLFYVNCITNNRTSPSKYISIKIQ